MIQGIAPIRPRTARTANSTSQSTVPLFCAHREQVGDPDQGEEQVAGEPGDDVVGGLVGDQGADQEGSRERQHPDVDRQQGGDHKDQPEDQDRDELRRHRHPPSCSCGAVTRWHLPMAAIADTTGDPASAQSGSSRHVRPSRQLGTS
jgi:hypothetical protein